MRRRAGGLLVVLCAACATPAPTGRVPDAADSPDTPEIASGRSEKSAVTFGRMAVAAAHPLAADAGLDILRQGGNALDAAIAAQMVLALVEPQSSGIGGGAFLMHWDGREVSAWDGRETAPAAADERWFLQADGQPLPLAQAMASGRAVGVPGAARMLEAAHRAHGRLAWPLLFAPAIRLAEQGFPIGPRLHALIRADAPLAKDPRARAYFFADDGSPLPVGHRLRNPALASVLRRLATEGSAALHQGPVAADVVRRVNAHGPHPGRLTEADLAGYRPLRRTPLCTDWAPHWRVCGFPPPSSGHLTLMQILGLLDAAPSVPPVLTAGVPGVAWLHVYTEAARLAFADRNLYLADPDFVPAPGGDWRALLDQAYLAQRAVLIGARSLQVAPAGVPGRLPIAQAPMAAQPEGGTSHLSVVDGDGRAVALTTSIEAMFGVRLMSDGGTGLAGGFLLNNQLTDFSFAPTDGQGRPIANRVQPGKRPRSSMSPTLVFDRRDGRLAMTLGSALGAHIIHATAKTLIGTFRWGLDVQAAIDLPHAASLNGPTVLEAGRFAPAVAEALRERGHVVSEAALATGLQALHRTPGGWRGGADPRREGVVRGE